MTERAGYLQGIADTDITWQALNFTRGNATLDVAVPVLTVAQMDALSARIKQASRDVLKAMTVSEIVDVIDRAIARLLDRNDPCRRKCEALLPLVTGYDAEMVRLGLTGYLKTFRKPELQKFIAEDFANPKILDEFQPAPKGGFTKAIGPDLLVHVWAGNVPGLPLWSMVAGLLVKAGSIGKLPSGEPLFAGWFAQLLTEVEPRLADCLAVVWWKGGDAVRETALLKQADTVIAYGGNESLSDLRQRIPVTTRYLPHGHKVSFGLVSRAALDTRKAPGVAQQAAYDVVRYDQQGCYSPHLFFVERGGRVSPREFTNYVAHALAGFETKYPRRALSIAEAGGIAAWRDSAETEALSHPEMTVIAGADGAWCAVYSEDTATLNPSGLNRTIRIVAIDSLDEVAPVIAPFRSFLQTVGIAAAPAELHRLSGVLGAAGVTRICALGSMSAPEAGWHHDGRFNLLDLVSMVEIEHSAEAAAEAFAPYTD
ncbi:MAG: acyl-CoA reductase [Proteobacteria bacterium]|nr:acyl-CoA reductase [Pseudomonadota bacterium]